MKLAWWKILSIILTLYVLIAGLLIPLKPGVVSINPTRIILEEDTKLIIQTYNTYHSKAKELGVWIKLDSTKLLKAKSVKAINDNIIEAHFLVSSAFQDSYDLDQDYTLVVDNEIDGYALHPETIRFRDNGNTSNSNLSLPIFQTDKIHQVDNFKFPYRPILYETIRNTFFHVAIWFAMFILLIYACYNSIQYLRLKQTAFDLKTEALVTVALYFGIAGILTGSFWARFTWGTFWTTDIKLNMSAVAMLVYSAYWLLRNSISDPDTKARMTAVYNLFSFVCLMFLVMVIPRFSGSDSLHPGNGGNPALGGEDLDSTLRAIFYPAIIAYTLIGLWVAQLYYRYLSIKDKFEFL